MQVILSVELRPTSLVPGVGHYFDNLGFTIQFVESRNIVPDVQRVSMDKDVNLKMHGSTFLLVPVSIF